VGNGGGHGTSGFAACAVQPANGKADLSGDMVLRMEKAFGVKMDTLMRMQASYDIAQTRKREKQIHVRRIHQLANIHA
jgi:plasmid maintenance system antidote protein VapI